MYEHRTKPLLPTAAFRRRLVAHGGVALGVIAFSLAIGVGGYHSLGRLPWIDALLNASMILGGMGPVDVLVSRGAKLFASIYALYAGFVLLAAVSVVTAPIVHRLLHRFHLEDERAKRESAGED